MKRRSQSVWHQSVYLTAALVALGLTFGMTPRTARAQGTACVGDCDGDSEVTISELLTMVNIALENAPVTDCEAGDPDGSGGITIDEILTAVNNALTACPVPTTAVCGNGTPETGEDCDQGGSCVGNAKAGTHCTSEADCGGPGVGGVCLAGSKTGSACAANTDCPNSTCIRCKTFGGNGCAANCTSERNFVFNLIPGMTDENDPLSVAAGTTGAVVHGEVITLPLPIGKGCLGGQNDGQQCEVNADCPGGGVCNPSTQTFTVGRDRGDGNVPLVVKSASVRFTRIDVGGLACACVRGVAQKTCGGTVFDADGVTQTVFCTEGFGSCDAMTHHCASATSVACTLNTDCEGNDFCTKVNGLPCALAHGEGNSGTGFAGCSSGGLSAVDFYYTQDAGGCDDPPACTKRTIHAPTISLTGAGPAGSAIILNSVAIGQAIGSCSGTDTSVYGNDMQICTIDDPQASRGTPQTIPLTTGTASAITTNANFVPLTAPTGPVTIALPCTKGDTTTDCQTACPAGAKNCTATGTQSGCPFECPYQTTGLPFSCSDLTSGQFPGGALVGSFVALAQPTVGDIVVTSQFFALH